jgi:hypothetical protein
LTKETIHLPLGCLQGGVERRAENAPAEKVQHETLPASSTLALRVRINEVKQAL